MTQGLSYTKILLSARIFQGYSKDILPGFEHTNSTELILYCKAEA